MQYRPALAFPAQPAPFSFAPGSPPVDEVEYRGSVFLIQFLNLAQPGFHHLLVPRGVFFPIGRRIAHQGVVYVVERGVFGRCTLICFYVLFSAFFYLSFSTVDVAQVVYFQHAHQFFHLLFVLEDGGHDDHGGVFVGYDAVFEFELECSARVVQLGEQPVEEVYHYLAHRHPQQQGEQDCGPRESVASGGSCGKRQRNRQRDKNHYPHIPPCTGIPPLRREECPPHVLSLLVGLRHQPLHQLVFSLPSTLFCSPFTHQPHYLRPVVFLRLVLHAVVHSRLLAFEHPLREAYGVNEFCHRQPRQLAQRHPNVHHHQVLLRRTPQILRIRQLLVRRRVVLCATSFQFPAQFRQPVYQHRLQQHRQRRHLRVAQVVLLAHLHPPQVAKQQLLVYRVVAPLHIPCHQLLQRCHTAALHAPRAPLYAPQLGPHHFFLLADHIVVVQDPLVCAAHRALTACLLDQQHIVARDVFHAAFECVI